MQEQGRVSPGQVWLLVMGFMVGSAILLQVAPAVKRDAWLALLLGDGLGILMAFVYTALLARFPGQTLVEIAPRLLGPWLGKTVGLLYVWFFLHLGALVLRNSWEFLTATVLKRTPPLATALVLALLMWYAVRGGLEVLARTAETVVPAMILLPTLFSLLLPGHGHLRNLLPMLEAGWLPLLKGSLQVATFPAGEVVVFAMLLPYMRPEAPRRRVVTAGIAAIAVLSALVVARDVAVLGPLREHIGYPAYVTISALTLSNFLEGLEGIIVVVWVAATFIKATVCLYAAVLGLAQGLGLRDYRPLTGPLAIAALILSFWVYPNVTAMFDFAATTWVPYAFLFEAVIPLGLLTLAVARRMRSGAAVSSR
ncbi:MAG: GerAB/ArcD/ProY family transporter [Symbiobacteriia bacterium]